MYAPSSVAQAAIPNPDQITRTLSKLEPDAALQQYATMHKNDPYIMSLAVAEANRRKALRAQPTQQQPTVVDQNIASMAPAPMPVPQQMPQQAMPPQQMAQQQRLPEQQGIGALPARNIENMADGGIAGYADGGVPGYAGGGQSQMFQDNPSAIQTLMPLAQNLQQLIEQTRAAAASGDPMAITHYAQAQQAARSKLENAATEQFGASAPQMLAQLMAGGSAPAAPAAPAAVNTISNQPGTMGAVVPRRAPASVRGDGAPPSPAVAVPRPQANAGVIPSAYPKVDLEGALKTTTPAEIAAIQAQNRANPDLVQAPFSKERAEAQAAAEAVPRNKEFQYEQYLLDRGDPYEKRSKRLEERETRLGKMEGESSGLAVLEAGLAIMGGTSQYAAANIGQGAQVGLKALKESKDKNERARERLDDAKEKIEDYKINFNDMSAKQKLDNAADIDRVVAQGQKDMVSALVTQLGFDQAQGTALTNMQVEVAEKGNTRAAEAGLAALRETGLDRRSKEDILSRERIAQAAAKATANALPDLYKQLGSAPIDSPLRKGFDLSKQENMVPTLLAAWTKAATDDTPSVSGGKHLTKGSAFMASFPTFADYLANLPGAVGGEARDGFSKTIPAGAPVLKTPSKP